MEYKYYIALSFAGEDRDYVDKVGQIIKENGVQVFYDKFEEVDLWGKDFGIHFDYVYRRQSKYFVTFISVIYEQKVWINYEVRAVFARKIENKEEAILPVIFDKTELDGIRSTLVYLDISKMPIEELANKILQKLVSETNVPVPEKEGSKGQVYLSTCLQVSEFYGMTGIMIDMTFTNSYKGYRYFGLPYFKISQLLHGTADTFHLMDAVTILSFPKRMDCGEQYQIIYNLKQGFLDQSL